MEKSDLLKSLSLSRSNITLKNYPFSLKNENLSYI